MNAAIDFEEVALRLLAWYRENRRDLPWRCESDPYRIWLSEVMLQQTKVKTMLPFYERFVREYPTIEDLARTDLDAVLSFWSGLGYYSRARNLHRAARLICDHHQGRFPDNLDQALALPGVGGYTARAVLSLAYGQPHPVVDGNVRRVLARFLNLKAKRSILDRSLWELLQDQVERIPLIRDTISEFNQGLMELGALVCTPRSPACGSCPLSYGCRAFIEGNPEAVPAMPGTKNSRRFHFLCAVIRQEGRYLMVRNSRDPFLKGFWEFPRVNGSPGESNLSSRFKMIGLDVEIERVAAPVQHQITFRSFRFYPCLGRLRTPPPMHDEIGWFDPIQDSIPVSSYIGKIRDRIENG